MSSQQQRGRRPVWIWPAVGGIFLAIVVIAFGIGQLFADVQASQTAQPEDRPTTEAPAGPAPSKVDAAELGKYWADNYSAVSWYPLTEVPTWDGNVLTAKTKLVADSDAKAPAISICGALSGYFVLSGKEFQSVRVLDGAGQILVSRHTQSDQCQWRR